MILTKFSPADDKALIKGVNFLAQLQEYRGTQDPSTLPIRQLSSHLRYLSSTKDCISESILLTAALFGKKEAHMSEKEFYDHFYGLCKIITTFADTARLMRDLKITSWSPAFYRKLAFVAGTGLIILFGKESVENARKLTSDETDKQIDRQEYFLKLIRSSSRCYLGLTLIRHSITLENYSGHTLSASGGDALSSCALMVLAKMKLMEEEKKKKAAL